MIVFDITGSDLMSATRIRQALSQAGRQFAGYNQDTWARELEHLGPSRHAFAATLGSFSSLRATATSPLAQGARQQLWQQPVLRELDA